MTREEVDVLLRNQRDARARGSVPAPVPGLLFRSCSCALLSPCDCGAELVRLALPSPVELTLPLPPSWNRAFRVVAMPTKARHTKGPFRGERVWTGRVYKSKEAEEYTKAIGSHVRRAGLEEPFERHVMLRVSGEMVMARAGCDLDDRFKVLLDALQGHVFVNDEQVAAFGEFPRRVDSSNPHVRLKFEPIAVDRYGKATQP